MLRLEALDVAWLLLLGFALALAVGLLGFGCALRGRLLFSFLLFDFAFSFLRLLLLFGVDDMALRC